MRLIKRKINDEVYRISIDYVHGRVFRFQGLGNLSAVERIDLNGAWIATGSEGFDFTFEIEETATRLDIQIMGKEVTPISYKKRKDQALIGFKNSDNEIYYLLAQSDKHEMIRLSITSEAVGSFMPVGQLGERVYKMKRLNLQPKILSASAK